MILYYSKTKPKLTQEGKLLPIRLKSIFLSYGKTYAHPIYPSEPYGLWDFEFPYGKVFEVRTSPFTEEELKQQIRICWNE